ncbi:hypothetical protein THAOC_13205, partial [Thalassiosira oceanica]
MTNVHGGTMTEFHESRADSGGRMNEVHAARTRSTRTKTDGVWGVGNLASVGHGGKTDAKVVKDADETEAVQKGGVFELEREETMDSQLDE